MNFILHSMIFIFLFLLIKSSIYGEEEEVSKKRNSVDIEELETIIYDNKVDIIANNKSLTIFYTKNNILNCYKSTMTGNALKKVGKQSILEKSSLNHEDPQESMLFAKTMLENEPLNVPYVEIIDHNNDKSNMNSGEDVLEAMESMLLGKLTSLKQEEIEGIRNINDGHTHGGFFLKRYTSNENLDGPKNDINITDKALKSLEKISLWKSKILRQEDIKAITNKYRYRDVIATKCTENCNLDVCNNNETDYENELILNAFKAILTWIDIKYNSKEKDIMKLNAIIKGYISFEREKFIKECSIFSLLHLRGTLGINILSQYEKLYGISIKMIDIICNKTKNNLGVYDMSIFITTSHNLEKQYLGIQDELKKVNLDAEGYIKFLSKYKNHYNRDWLLEFIDLQIIDENLDHLRMLLQKIYSLKISIIQMSLKNIII